MTNILMISYVYHLRSIEISSLYLLGRSSEQMRKVPDTKTFIPAVALFGLLVALFVEVAIAQNCGCAPNLCCSRFGFCGTTDDYCGTGCQQGPCKFVPKTNNVVVANIVTPRFFNGIISQASSTCEGKNFYSRASFLKALESYPKFGREGTVDDSKREIAAFFAHLTHESGNFCYINEINGTTRNYCDATNTRYPCVPGKAYFGRGPIQLSWNYNYGPAGESIGFDGLNSPETVARDPVIAFKTAFWYWMNNVHSIIVSGQGFGATIRAINGALECNRGNSAQVESRVRYYLDYCRQIKVDPGQNLRC